MVMPEGNDKQTNSAARHTLRTRRGWNDGTQRTRGRQGAWHTEDLTALNHRRHPDSVKFSADLSRRRQRTCKDYKGSLRKTIRKPERLSKVV